MKKALLRLLVCPHCRSQLKLKIFSKKTNNFEVNLLEKAKVIMAKVMKETDRATAITKKLSNFAKPSKGEAVLIDINKEVDEVLGLVGYELKLEKIAIVFIEQ